MERRSLTDYRNSLPTSAARHDKAEQVIHLDDIVGSKISVASSGDIQPVGKNTKAKLLPSDFKPAPYSVIIGRGKESKEAIGNRRLRVLASTFMDKYADAINKTEKSKIVSSLVTMVRDACPTGAFIKLGKDGRWFEVEEAVAREKVGYTFRELLGGTYRSSSFSKVARRNQQRSSQETQTEVEWDNQSSIFEFDCSEDWMD
jgi:hypothetical protein